MTNSEKLKLQKEYARMWNSFIIWPLRLTGWARFDMDRFQCIPKKPLSILHNIFIIILANLCKGHVLYITSVRDHYLWTSEILIVFMFSSYLTLVVGNMTFANREGGARIINYFIDIDILLGVRQTKFIRKAVILSYILTVAIMGMIEICLYLVLLLTYDVDPSVYGTGILYFFLIYFAYYDITFFLCACTALTLRARYLNVAVMKAANMNPSILPKGFPFSTFFWPSKLDKLVDFHMRASMNQIVKAYKMIFNQLQNVEDAFRFMLTLTVVEATFAAFVTVQSYIDSSMSETVEHKRLIAITLSCLLGWFIMYSIADQLDMFHRQINQTQLICTYIQLKTTYSEKIYELTGKILSILDNRSSRINMYNTYYYDKGMLLRFSSSIFVYITMQLQIAFPKRNDLVIKDNATLIAG